MQGIEKFQEMWAEHKEWRDVSELARLTGKDHTRISRILSGKLTTVTSEELLIINTFYKKRAQIRKKAQEID